MKTLTENQVAAGLLNDFIDVEHLEYFHLKPLYEVNAEWNGCFLRRCSFNFPTCQDFLFDFSKSLDYRPSRQSQDSIVVCGVTLTDPLSRTKSDNSENILKIIYYPLFRMLKEDSVSNLTQKNASSTPNLNVLNGTAASYFANLDKSVNWKGLRQSRSMESLTTSPNMSLTHSFDDGKNWHLLTGAWTVLL